MSFEDKFWDIFGEMALYISIALILIALALDQRSKKRKKADESSERKEDPDA